MTELDRYLGNAKRFISAALRENLFDKKMRDMAVGLYIRLVNEKNEATKAAVESFMALYQSEFLARIEKTDPDKAEYLKSLPRPDHGITGMAN